MSVRMVFDANKLKRDLQKAAGEEAEKAVKRISNRDKIDIGEQVIDEMKTAIAKGISPIKDAGRFPAYLWAGKKQLARKSGTKKKQADREFKNKYPYSAMKDFPDKRERPVNLALSGAFLRALKAKVQGSTLYIGFFDGDKDKHGTPFGDYESGHREGVFGQPKRPIIPDGKEELSQSVYRRLVKALQEVFDRQK